MSTLGEVGVSLGKMGWLMVAQGGGRRHWAKVLYEKQPFDDNYVDESFLESLVTNDNLKECDYRKVVGESISVSQQISTAASFAVVFTYTESGMLPVEFVLWIDVLLLVFGYAFYLMVNQSFSLAQVPSNLRTCVLIVGGLGVLSPVLQTLTQNFTNDSVWFFTILLGAVHLFFHDYRYANASTTAISGTTSLNAAIFGSVLLASRLPTISHVFAILLLAVEFFILFPMLRHTVRRYSVDLHTAMHAIMFAITTALLFPLSVTVALSFVGGTLLVTIIAPYAFMKLQKYRIKINGPWDNAVPITHHRVG